MSRNLTFDLIEHARVRPAAPALLLAGSSISYGALDQLVWRYTLRLHELGVRPGQVLGVTFTEELGLVLALLALGRLGATAHSIPRSASATQRRQMATRAHLTWLASDQPERYDAGIPGLRLARHEMTDLPASAGNGLMCVNPDAPWLLIAGSGSTGRSKLIPLTHEQARARARLGASGLQLKPHDRVAALSHFDFAHAKQRLLEALTTGAAYAIQAWRGGADTPRYCARLELSVLYATVFHAGEMLAAANAGTLDELARLRAFELGASTVSGPLRQRVIRTLTPRLYVRYASNESGPIAIAAPDQVLQHPGTVGRAFDGVELQIVDRRGQAVPAGTVGLIRVSSAGLVEGYQDDAAASRQSFQHGGFRPDDLGMLGSDGELIHYGRADHMMIMDGTNVYPTEIEQAMCAHPDVADAVALPWRHPIHQDIPVCAIALRRGSELGEPALLAHAREQLGALAPRRIVVLDRLPRTPAGKLMRSELEQLFMTRLGFELRKAGPPTPAIRPRSKLVRQIFKLDEQADLRQLETWLDALLAEPQGVAATAPRAATPARQRAAEAWIGCALRLAPWLLQAGHIPVFGRPQVMALAAVDAAAGSWQADVVMDLVDHLPAQAYSEALTAALALCELAAGTVLTDVSLQEFHRRADQARIRLSRLMPVGKSTLPLLRTAHELGIPFTHLGAGVFQLGWGSQACRLDCSATGVDSAIGAKLAHSQVLTARLLRLSGLPVPEHRVVNRIPAALAAAQELGWPVMVKPADLERGEGITVDVVDAAGLRSAFALAQRMSPARQVLVERQLAGGCHRLLIGRGRLLYAVKALPLSVIADGRSSIAELVDEEVSTTVHPENLRIALDAAKLLGLDMAGIDIISPDISQPWFENGAVISKVNYSPELDGGEISRRHLRAWLEQLLPERGRIPIEIFVGSQSAWTAASLRWQQLLAGGLKAWLSSSTLTLAPSGQTHQLPWSDGYRRARALAMWADVDALVLTVTSQEFASSELPFERVDRVIRQDEWPPA